MVDTIGKAKSWDHFIVLWIFNSLPDVGRPFQPLEVRDRLEPVWLAAELLWLSLSVVCPLPPPVQSLFHYLLHSEPSRISLTPNTRLYSVLNIVPGFGQLWDINICTYYKDNQNLGQRSWGWSAHLEAQVVLILHCPYLDVQVLEPPWKEQLGGERHNPG